MLLENVSIEGVVLYVLFAVIGVFVLWGMVTDLKALKRGDFPKNELEPAKRSRKKDS